MRSAGLGAMGVVVLLAACGRGPGTLQGSLEGRPFELKQARASLGAHQLIVVAGDQLTECAQRTKSGRLLELRLNFPTTDLPAPGVYPLVDAGPGAVVVRQTTNDLCNPDRTVSAGAAEVELVELRGAGTAELEADLRVRVTFREGVLEGSLHATSCTANSAPFCEATQTP